MKFLGNLFNKPTMKLIAPILLILLISCTSKKSVSKNSIEYKETVDELFIEDWKEPQIGFACYDGGQETSIVRQFRHWFEQHKFDSITSELFSEHPSSVFLATFLSEKLEKERMIHLSEAKKNQILRNRQKTDLIYTCSGCTEFQNFSLKQVLTDSTNYILEEANWWFEDLTGRNIISE